MNNTSFPFVSVVIPVYNDGERLKKCLAVLEEQTYPADRYEVIVVDNGSDENPAAIVSGYSQAKIVHERVPGPGAARNKGVAAARGSVIAFTDSDCVPEKDWIEKGVEKLMSLPGCGLAAGRIKLLFKNPADPTVIEHYENTVAYQQEKYIEEQGSAITANFFTFRDMFDKVGFFDNSLQPLDDYEWTHKVFLAGHKIVYAPGACVGHPARDTLGRLTKKVLWLTGGFYKLEKKYIKFPGDLTKTFSEYIRSTWRDIVRILSEEKLEGYFLRFRVILLILFVRLVYISERIRLMLGGRPRR